MHATAVGRNADPKLTRRRTPPSSPYILFHSLFLFVRSSSSFLEFFSCLLFLGGVIKECDVPVQVGMDGAVLQLNEFVHQTIDGGAYWAGGGQLPAHFLYLMASIVARFTTFLPPN